MPVKRTPLALSALLCVLVLAGHVVLAQPPSEALLVGSYRCMSYNVSGGGGSCANFPRLVLNADGTYQYSSTTGRWTIQNRRLVLSASALWGPGTVVARDTIRFEYDSRGWHHVITWVCQGCSEQAAAPSPARSGIHGAAASSVGVTLTLKFSQPIGGVSSYAIVPAEAARDYRHNGPIPPGAVTGLASEATRNSVRLATNRNNKLLAGRQYVIFLEWPRESIPVAILDLPLVNDDYTVTLEATLDGASILARIGKRPEPPRFSR